MRLKRASGSVVALIASVLVGRAQAADLPARPAVAVDYVQVCSTHGVGYLRHPGDGNLPADRRTGPGGIPISRTRQPRHDAISTRARGRIELDARTATAYGALRSLRPLRGDAEHRELRVEYVQSRPGLRAIRRADRGPNPILFRLLHQRLQFRRDPGVGFQHAGARLFGEVRIGLDGQRRAGGRHRATVPPEPQRAGLSRRGVRAAGPANAGRGRAIAPRSELGQGPGLGRLASDPQRRI